MSTRCYKYLKTEKNQILKCHVSLYYIKCSVNRKRYKVKVHYDERNLSEILPSKETKL